MSQTNDLQLTSDAAKAVMDRDALPSREPEKPLPPSLLVLADRWASHMVGDLNGLQAEVLEQTTSARTGDWRYFFGKVALLVETIYEVRHAVYRLTREHAERSTTPPRK